MPKCYFELRTQAARGTDSMAADMMRHLHTRQYLGKTLIVSHDPFVALGSARKQWLRISRTIQKQRSSTLNADKILKYTHTITHMQHMRFTLKLPLDFAVGDVFFLRPDDLTYIPAQTYSIYTSVELPANVLETMVTQLPAEALLIDYHHVTNWEALGMQPKSVLETGLNTAWQQALQFLKGQNIDIAELQSEGMQNIEAMDEALDTLLGMSHRFLQVATAFQRALELARPLHTSKAVRQQYDTLALLAHRVQALSPSAFTQQFLEVYNEDDTFFLFDLASETDAANRLSHTIVRARTAGRLRLADALEAHPHKRIAAIALGI